MEDFENKMLWEDPSIASILYDSMSSWENGDGDPEPDQKTEKVISDRLVNLDDETDDQNAVYWNTLPKKLRIFLKLKFLDPIDKLLISKTEMEGILKSIGFTKEFVTHFSKENITTDEISKREAEWWIGMCIVSSQEAHRASTKSDLQDDE
jgi:hypothetical protein